MEKVENVLKSCPLVEQVWVYGNSFESCLVGLVVPAEKPIMAWAAQRGIKGSYEVRALCVCVFVWAGVCVCVCVCVREELHRVLTLLLFLCSMDTALGFTTASEVAHTFACTLSSVCQLFHCISASW